MFFNIDKHLTDIVPEIKTSSIGSVSKTFFNFTPSLSHFELHRWRSLKLLIKSRFEVVHTYIVNIKKDQGKIPADDNCERTFCFIAQMVHGADSSFKSKSTYSEIVR